MSSVRFDGCDLYYEEAGDGVPILLVHPAGATASTWGAAAGELTLIGRVVAYDRRGYARSGGEPVHQISMHTADAAAILEHLRAPPAVVVGTSAGAAIAVDLAVRRPDLLRAVVAHEFPWRFTHHLPSASQAATLAKIGTLALRGRHGDAADECCGPPTPIETATPRGTPFRIRGDESPGRTPGPPWRTSGAPSGPIRRGRSSRPSTSRSCAPMARGAPTAWSA